MRTRHSTLRLAWIHAISTLRLVFFSGPLWVRPFMVLNLLVIGSVLAFGSGEAMHGPGFWIGALAFLGWGIPLTYRGSWQSPNNRESPLLPLPRGLRPLVEGCVLTALLGLPALATALGFVAMDKVFPLFSSRERIVPGTLAVIAMVAPMVVAGSVPRRLLSGESFAALIPPFGVLAIASGLGLVRLDWGLALVILAMLGSNIVLPASRLVELAQALGRRWPGIRSSTNYRSGLPAMERLRGDRRRGILIGLLQMLAGTALTWIGIFEFSDRSVIPLSSMAIGVGFVLRIFALFTPLGIPIGASWSEKKARDSAWELLPLSADTMAGALWRHPLLVGLAFTSLDLAMQFIAIRQGALEIEGGPTLMLALYLAPALAAARVVSLLKVGRRLFHALLVLVALSSFIAIIFVEWNLGGRPLLAWGVLGSCALLAWPLCGALVGVARRRAALEVKKELALGRSSLG